jgi:hypothetical protein
MAGVREGVGFFCGAASRWAPACAGEGSIWPSDLTPPAQRGKLGGWPDFRALMAAMGRREGAL